MSVLKHAFLRELSELNWTVDYNKVIFAYAQWKTSGRFIPCLITDEGTDSVKLEFIYHSSYRKTTASLRLFAEYRKRKQCTLKLERRHYIRFEVVVNGVDDKGNSLTPVLLHNCAWVQARCFFELICAYEICARAEYKSQTKLTQRYGHRLHELLSLLIHEDHLVS